LGLLGTSVELRQCATWPLLGVPMELRTNSATVLQIAERAFGRWRLLPESLTDRIEPRRVELIVRDSGAAARTPRECVHGSHDGRFFGVRGEEFLWADLDRGHALGLVTPESVADEPGLRYGVIECLALLLVSRQDRTPLHAAAVVVHGR